MSTIAFLGLGIMGQPMSERLIKAGHGNLDHSALLRGVERLSGHTP